MATDGASIGSVYVDILPKTDGLWARVQAQAGPGADRAGTDLGAIIAKALADRIAKGVDDGIDQGSRRSVPRSTKGGEESGGAFADAFKRRVEAGLRAISDAKIGVDASEADRKLAELRARLAELGTKRVGVDITDAQAIADLRQLQVELARLSRESPSIRVSTDAARASAELAAVLAEAEQIARANPNIHIDTNAATAAGEIEAVNRAANSSSGGMRNLIAAGIAMGPGIIPVAAAVAAAVAGIGVGALAGVGAIGAVVLGTRGIGDAVKAMAGAQDDAGKSAVQMAQRQSQIASAADSVRSAEASLSNTRASAAESARRAAETTANSVRAEADARINAADAARRAAETVTNAQDGLARAEHDALQAEQDLTRARESARRAMEDLATQVADGALAQRAAVIDLEKAEANLTAVRWAGAGASRLQREEAQLAYDRARQNITDLGVRQGRLVADQQTAQQAGVEGSAQVVAAQDRVAQSQDQVRKSTRALEDARTAEANTARTNAESIAKAVQAVSDARIAEANTARQNAFSVQQAAQGVVSAQRSLQAATEQAGTSGSAAMDKLKTAMAALSPEGREFAVFLYGLRGVWIDLKNAAQGGLLPGAEAGLKAMLPLVPEVTGYVHGLSLTVGGLAAEAGQAFSQPYWRDFYRFLAQQANPALHDFAGISYNVVLGLSGIVRAGAPLGQDFGAGLLHFAQDFAHWGTSLSTSSGFLAFMQYVRTEGPHLVEVVKDVAVAVGHIVVAAAPLGGPVLSAIDGIAKAISALPVDVLTGIIAAVQAIVIANRAWAVVQALVSGWTTTLSIYNGTLAATKVLMSGAADGAGRFSGAMSAGKTAANETKGGLGSLAAFISGPLGIAVAAGIGLFSLWTHDQEVQKQKIDDLRSSLRGYASAFKDGVTPAAEENARQLVAHDDKLRGFIDTVHAAGISQEEMVRGLNGDADARKNIIAKLDEQIRQEKIAQSEARHGSDSENEASQAHKDRADALERERIAFAKVNTEQAKAAEAAREVHDARADELHVDKALSDSQLDLVSNLENFGNTALSAAQRADAFRGALQGLYDTHIKLNEATEGYDGSLAGLQDQMAQSNAGFDLHRAKTSQQTEEILRNRDSLEQALLKTRDYTAAQIEAGVPMDQVTSDHQNMIDQILREIPATQRNSDVVRKLVDDYGKIPPSKTTDVSVTGIDRVMFDVRTALAAQRLAQFPDQGPQAAKDWASRVTGIRDIPGGGFVRGQSGLATGGPVFGPGGPTDDMVPAWGPGDRRFATYRLSNDEHVWTAAEVHAAGGHAAVEDLRRRVLGSQGPRVLFPGDGSQGIKFRFADGGGVWPIKLDMSRTWVPTVEWAVAHAFGPASPAVQRTQAFIRAQAGKPYIWASAGPEGYDCSGIVSAALNVYRGRNPYAHTFSTSNEAAYFSPGSGIFSAGWTNPGEPGPGGGDVGHTAGRLAGLAFESVGGEGVRIGSRVTPIGAFAHVGHADPGTSRGGVKAFDSGGILPPGATLAWNGTGRNEFVLTDQQLQQLGTNRATQTGRDVTIHVHGSDGQSITELAAAVRHELAWELR